MDEKHLFKVFISYAREDVKYAERIQQVLEEAKIEFWRDTRDLDPNQDFTAELERAIEQSERVVCCITPDVKRPDSFVRREISYALKLKKPIIPLIFENTLPPIHIINVTNIDFSNQAFDVASKQLLLRVQSARYEDKTLEQVTLPEDPYRIYLNDLYERLNDDLEERVFALLELHSTGKAETAKKITVSMTGEPLFFSKKTKHENSAEFENFRMAYERYDRRVLLLGEPGAGKTVTLLAFARDAVTYRLQDPSAPLPIFASIRMWNAQTQPSLVDWLGTQVNNLDAYEIAELIHKGQVLLLLDGLDELGVESEIKDEVNSTKDKIYPMKRFINKFNAEFADNYAVISSRTEDYNIIGEKLPLNGVVTLKRLNDSQIRHYLRELPVLIQAINQDEFLLDLVRTPLILSLFTIVYSEAEPHELDELRNLGTSSWNIRNKVFDTFMIKAYEAAKSKRIIEFSLNDLYMILGRLAIQDINILNRKGANIDYSLILEIVQEQDKVVAFATIAQQLYLLAKVDDDQWRFRHLLLRDYFVFAYGIAVLKIASHPVLQMMAIDALGVLQTQEAVPALIYALHNPHPMIRESAMDVLGNLKDPRAIPDLSILVADNAKGFWRPRIGDAALRALRKIGTLEALNIVAAWERDPGPFRKRAIELGIIKGD
jgi:hypothetical protein